MKGPGKNNDVPPFLPGINREIVEQLHYQPKLKNVLEVMKNGATKTVMMATDGSRQTKTTRIEWPTIIENRRKQRSSCQRREKKELSLVMKQELSHFGRTGVGSKSILLMMILDWIQSWMNCLGFVLLSKTLVSLLQKRRERTLQSFVHNRKA